MAHLSYTDTDNSPRLTIDDLKKVECAALHILRRVSIESIWGLLEHRPVIELTPGELLIQKEQSNQCMYLVLSGSLNVHLESPTSEPVTRLTMGQTVGEISVIDDSPATAWVTAADTCRLLSVDEDTFWRMVEVSHAFATNLLLLLAGRLRANNSRIVDELTQRLQLEHDATVDALTGLRNRRWLDMHMERMIKRHQFSKTPMAFIMLDVDHFKRFNDSYGHAAGDRVLAAVSHTIMDKLRPTDLAARFGGEEFCLLLPDTPLEGGIVAAERVRRAVASNAVHCADGRRLPPVTISLGVADLHSNDTPASLLERGDQLLYQAKQNGRNRVESTLPPTD